MAVSRYPMWGKEQVKIMAQFEVNQALIALGEFEGRISSLQSLGAISKSDGEKMKKQIAGMREIIKKPEKKAKSKK